MSAKSGSSIGKVFARGEHLIWITGSALGVCLLMIAGLLVVVVLNGMGYFWPHPLTEITLRDGSKLMGVLTQTEEFRKFEGTNEPVTMTRSQFKVGNRDLSQQDFRWIEHPEIVGRERPRLAVALEREEYGDFYGYLQAIQEQGRTVAEGEAAWKLLLEKNPVAHDFKERVLRIQKVEIGGVNAAIQKAQLKIKRLERRLPPGPERDAAVAGVRAAIAQQQARFETLKAEAQALQTEGNRYQAVMKTADGREKVVPLSEIVRAFRPNDMSLPAKWGHYGGKIWEFATGEPRESNTEGGIFPAIFGTVVMTILMSLAVVPFGVLAAFYLREYAKQGFFVRCVRIAVNNLAGVPSIVFGVFGLGFFVYFVGGGIDRLFYPESLPSPTFGTGGILWASLTLALLTVPVVIVATEESIAAVPRGAKEG
ncbi:MAG TPA: phosphate ABC transporter, permease protein PstA, partial [Methylomirabilota bacterium]|nr:phosphate ABC transporter, permease protein PstA [Methylomirabilota bacterium]